MNRPAHQFQRIARLTPLQRVLAWIDETVHPAAPRLVATEHTAGCCLADDLVLATDRPAHDRAWRDGWAVRSEDTSDAGGYAPAVLPALPARLDAGEPLPDGVDAVAPLDAVDTSRGIGEALMPVAPGEGVLAAGFDGRAGEPLGRSGARLRLADVAALAALGIADVSVRRPRLCVVAARQDAIFDAFGAYLAGAIIRAGGEAGTAPSIEAAAAAACDAVVVIGGTGGGRTDDSVRRLAALGRVAFHGVGLSPGETTALGIVAGRPVLVVPGRLDAALTAWLVLGRPLMARLAGDGPDEPAVAATLTAKIVSSLGVAELVLLRREGDGVAPLAAGHLPLSLLPAADAWTLVAAESEGSPAGATIPVRPLS